MFRKVTVSILAVTCMALLGAPGFSSTGRQEFPVAGGGTLILDLEAGGSVEIRGTSTSSIVVAYNLSCTPECDIAFDERRDGVEIRTSFVQHGRGRTTSHIDLEIEVPHRFDIEFHSTGGGLSISGVEGRFSGRTMGGELTLHDVNGEAELTTMGGEITLTDSVLDGSLETMGGKVLFENVVGDVKGTSLGGNVRYKNVQRRDGQAGSPPRTGGDLDDVTSDTVQISTMGGSIRVEDAPDGADLHTMGGPIEIRDARYFVRAVTMGGDIRIDSIDGWVEATTMSGDVQVTMTGRGGDVTLTSMSGDIVLFVPSGFGMSLDLEIAFTRNSSQQYRIDTPGGLRPTVSPDWDYGHGSPRKYIRSSGLVNGGGNTVTIKTINGNITVREGR